ncbi:MAG: M28 family peptidase [Deltaproteobacteria bacterium]|nr:MAG: M28 family peptidase [Deltaproteobacteria bacterium]
MSSSPLIQDERSYSKSLIERLVQEFPKRLATTPAEKGAQDLVAEELSSLGYKGEFESFRFNRSLYANLMLHGAVGVAGTLASFYNLWVGLALHLLAFVSYFADNTRKFYLLRRLFPFRPSQNYLVTLPATAAVRMRIVMLAHIDAAYTGWLFHPAVVKQAAKPPPPGLGWTKFSIGLGFWSLLPLIILDTVALTVGWSSWILYVVFGIPTLLMALLNLQIVLKNEIVPGANDNLTGVASLPLLLSRLHDWKPDDVELVFVVTGAEEASLGGAHALYRKYQDKWDRSNTFILGLDTLSGGELFYMKEGDIWPCPFPMWLPPVLESTKATDDSFQNVREFRIPVGGTDAIPFLYGGYDGVSLGCVDLEYGAPRHYHYPTDTPENLDYDEFMLSIDFAEALILQLNERYSNPS